MEKNIQNNSLIKLKDALYKLQYILYIPLLLLMCTVFIINGDFGNPTVAGKYIFFYFLTGCVILSGVFIVIFKSQNLKIGYIDICLFLFFISFLIVSLWNNNDITKHRLILLTLLGILYFYLKIHIQIYPSISFLLTLTLLFTGFIEAIWGLFQLYGLTNSYHTYFKITGSFFNPGPYGGYIAVLFPLAVYYALYDNKIKQEKISFSNLPVYVRWKLSIFTTISTILVLPPLMNRAAWIASFCGGLFVTLIWYKERKQLDFSSLLQLRKTKMILAGLTIILCCSLSYIYLLKKDSADGRFLIWKLSSHTIIRHPWGTGVGTFPAKYGQSQFFYFLSEKGTKQENRVAGNPEYGFNEYLQICVEGGFISFLLYLLLIGLIIRTGLKYRVYPILGAFISFLIFSAMSYPFSVLPFLILFLTLTALVAHKKSTYTLKKRPLISITVILTLIACLLLPDQIKSMEAYKKWKEIKPLYDTGIYDIAAKEYEKIASALEHENLFLFEYAQCLSKSQNYNESNKVIRQALKSSCDPMFFNILGKNYQELGQYHKAEECYKHSAILVPSRLYPWYLLAKLYHETGEFDKFCEINRIIQEKEIKVYSPAIEEMKEELKRIYQCPNNE